MRRASDAVHGLSLAAILGGMAFMAVALMADDAPLIWACGGSIALGVAGVLRRLAEPPAQGAAPAKSDAWWKRDD